MRLIIALILILIATETMGNHYGYYRINRDSVATWKEIDKNVATITANSDTIRIVSSELSNEISYGIEKNGIRKELKTHQRFYYPIIFFGILYLIWLKTRDK